MLKVGITGGIGSGKSIVCQVFKTLGIPVFNADAISKYFMENNIYLKKQIVNLLGDNAYIDNKLDRAYISNKIFKDKSLLLKLNALVHPITIEYGKQWMLKQSAPYTIKESAILFESGTNKELDYIIGVNSPLETRIARTIERDNISSKKVLEKMNNQMNNEQKMSLCHFVINNSEHDSLIYQVIEINEKLLKLSNN